MTALVLPPIAPRSWRPLYIGCSRLLLRSQDGIEVALDYYDGGGAGPGYGVWRMAGRVVSIISAGCA